MRRLLLDTNYLLDYAEPGRPDEAAAIELFRQVVSGRYEGVVAASSLKDFYYLARKWQGDQAARDWLRVFMRAFTVVELDIEACAMAVDSDEPDFEDGCIRAIAERDMVDCIITRDEWAFVRSRVKSFSASAFLDLFPVARDAGKLQCAGAGETSEYDDAGRD